MRTLASARTRPLLLAPLSLALLAGHALAQPGDRPGNPPDADAVSLTIYSTAVPGAIPADLYRPVPQSLQQLGYGQQGYYYGGRPGVPGYAIIRQDRTLTLPEGRSTISFTDVAALLDPTTVTFTSLTAPDDTKVVEQSYQYDLISPQKMLERFTGQTVILDSEQVTLLSANAGGGLLIKGADGAVRWRSGGVGALTFPEMPEELITQPTLVWDLHTTKPGDHRTRVSYQTQGITWWADYNVILTEGADANAGTIDLSAWVSILNQSGAAYADARLKLIAGDVHRAPAPGERLVKSQMAREMAMADAAPAGFEEKAFFEYHLYTLGRPTTIPQASTKQIELFDPARNVPAEKVLVYYGVEPSWRPYWSEPALNRDLGVPGNHKVDVYLSFKNDKEHGMGMPLPSGRVRVSKLDPADGSLEFIGEDVIDHTARNETVLLKLGESFDVVGERVQTDFRVNQAENWLDETIQIKLRNRKDQPVKVLVRENLYRWTNWEIVESSHQFEKQDARTIHIPVTLKPDEEAVVTYKVHYTW